MAKNKSELSIILKPIIFITIIVLIVGAIGYFTLGKDAEVIEGQVEVTEYRVSSKVPGRILTLYVQEGQQVHAGDTLVRLDAPDVAAKMEQARSAEDAAQAVSNKANNGTRKEQIQGALQLWKQAQAAVTIAQKTYKRMKNLYDEGVIPAQRLDEATAKRDAAVASEQAAHSQYQMAVNGARQEDKEAAQAIVNQTKGSVAEVKSYINETVLTASADGEVSEIFPKVGELVGTGSPIMNISELQDMWVTFNVREDLLKDLKQGAVVRAFIPAFGNQEISLRVYYIKDLGSYAAWKATKSTGQYDLRTFEVKARPTKPVKDLRPGMTVVLKRDTK
ncbi:MAG: efflux RND transporter periplasmic adaptor subunit [Prevotellaceae bacterium]|nr:efflux RND transporter periplasmic adaptor subunit [Prevotellaceae bacterium]MDY3856789.1 efflux RND transporter periplasmic adaptor subunit [Bacteroidaceae bacterium]